MHSRATDRRSASKCQGKWPDRPLDHPFGLPEGAGSRPHLASVFQGRRKSNNIHASSGVIWGIPAKILPQIPLGRLGEPEEIADLIIYLCSDGAAFVTDANIAINGGQHMQ